MNEKLKKSLFDFVYQLSKWNNGIDTKQPSKKRFKQICKKMTEGYKNE